MNIIQNTESRKMHKFSKTFCKLYLAKTEFLSSKCSAQYLHILMYSIPLTAKKVR